MVAALLPSAPERPMIDVKVVESGVGREGEARLSESIIMKEFFFFLESEVV
jgi:hypothetical protein